MLSLADILKPRHVELALGSADSAAGIEQLAHRLEGDAGMLNWTAFQAELPLAAKPVGRQSLLSHLRTDHVARLLMAVGRFPAQGGGEEELRFLFLIAVPKTLVSEYLRTVGALARSLRNPAIVAALSKTASPEEFVQILCAEAAGI